MTRRQRLKTSPIFRDFNTGIPRVDQVLGRFAEALREAIGAAGQLLRILDGNTTPSELQPDRDRLRFEGAGVTVTSPNGASYVNVSIPGGTAYTGVDGVDVTGSQVRASRDTLTVTLTGNQNNYAPTGWDTADILFLTTTSIRIISGFAAPSSPDGTVAKLITNDTASINDIFLSHESGSSSAANRIILPGNVSSLALSPGESAWLMYADSRWYVTAVARDVQSLIVTSHSDLSDLDVPGDHPWALLRDGSRSLTGTWNLGDNILNGADTLNFNGAGSAIAALQTMTFTGSGSSIGTLQTITMLTGGTASIDMNAGDINDIGVLQLNDVDSHTGPSTGTVEVVGFSGPDTANPGGMLRRFSNSFLWNFPLDVQIDASTSGGSTLVSTINFASIAGYNLTDRVIHVGVKLQSSRTDSSDTAYGTQCDLAEFTIDTNQTGNANVALRAMAGIVNASPFDPVVIDLESAPNVSSISGISAVSTSSTSVTFTGPIVGSGTRRAMMLVYVIFCYI